MRKVSLLAFFVLVSCSSSLMAASVSDGCIGNNRITSVQEELYAVGFSSRSDLFAYIRHGYNEGMGSYYWQLNIQDLAGNNVVDTVEVIVGIEKMAHPTAEFVGRARKSLEANSIELKDAPELISFPLEIGDSRLDAYIVKAETMEDDGVSVIKRDIVLADEGFNFNKIGEVSEVVFFGHPKRYDYKIAGYVRSPESDYVAVVVSFRAQENEQSDLICTFTLFGGNLNIPERDVNDKLEFRGRLIEKLP